MNIEESVESAVSHTSLRFFGESRAFFKGLGAPNKPEIVKSTAE